jgi:hypothetical protein
MFTKIVLIIRIWRKLSTIDLTFANIDVLVELNRKDQESNTSERGRKSKKKSALRKDALL